MSKRHPLLAARRLAECLRAELAPACERIEIAGSIRRGVPEVKDVELVAIPKTRRDLLGVMVDEPTGLCLRVDELIAEGRFAPREPRRMGRKFKALVAVRTGIPLDLFAVLPPASWGAIFAIRTGPADYSRRLVTEARRRGRPCVDGRLVERVDGELIDVLTPKERDFILACGLSYEEPEARRA